VFLLIVDYVVNCWNSHCLLLLECSCAFELHVGGVLFECTCACDFCCWSMLCSSNWYSNLKLKFFSHLFMFVVFKLCQLPFWLLNNCCRTLLADYLLFSKLHLIGEVEIQVMFTIVFVFVTFKGRQVSLFCQVYYICQVHRIFIKNQCINQKP
jgi:hypothetical protein